MREIDSREIDGVTFRVQQLPVKRAIKLMHKLARAGVPALLKAVGGSDLKKLSLSDLDLSSLGDAATMLFDRFSEQDLDQVMQELLEGATLEFEGKELPALKSLDVALRGKPLTLMKGLGFALEVNFGDFLPALLAAGGALG